MLLFAAKAPLFFRMASSADPLVTKHMLRKNLNRLTFDTKGSVVVNQTSTL